MLVLELELNLQHIMCPKRYILDPRDNIISYYQRKFKASYYQRKFNASFTLMFSTCESISLFDSVHVMNLFSEGGGGV